jgi:carbamoyl-phosphate synthase small subunit
LIVREACERSSNFRSAGELSAYLVQHGVPGIDQIDTRMLTRRVRTGGAMRVMLTEDLDTGVDVLLQRIKAAPTTSDVDHVVAVTTKENVHWTRGDETLLPPPRTIKTADRRTYKVVAYDFGAKRNILRSLVESGFDVTVVPAMTPAEAVLEHQPDGVFLSNGPGDPAICTYAVEAAAKLVRKLPVFGICLGHQVLGQV